jgi:hypothetical protein
MERTGLYAEEVEETGTGDEEYEDDEQAAPEAPTVDYLSWGAVLQWTLATAAGFWAGLLLLWLIFGAGSWPTPSYYVLGPLAYVQMGGLSGLAGGLIGLCVGVLQWLVWFHHTRYELAWIRATWVGWACASILVYVVYEFMPFGRVSDLALSSNLARHLSFFDEVARGLVAGVVAGAMVGLLQGLAFVQAGIGRFRIWFVATVLVSGATAVVSSFYFRVLVSSRAYDLLDFVPGLMSMLVMFGGLSGSALWAMINRPVIRRPGHVIAVAVLLIASVLSAFVITITQPQSLRDPSRIRITRQHYDEALAKWRAANILEYELTVTTTGSWGGVSRKLRVSEQGKKIEVLEPESDAELIS